MSENSPYSGNLLKSKSPQIESSRDKISELNAITATLFCTQRNLNRQNSVLVAKDELINSLEVQLSEQKELHNLKDMEIANLQKKLEESAKEKLTMMQELDEIQELVSLYEKKESQESFEIATKWSLKMNENICGFENAHQAKMKEVAQLLNECSTRLEKLKENETKTKDWERERFAFEEQMAELRRDLEKFEVEKEDWKKQIAEANSKCEDHNMLTQLVDQKDHEISNLKKTVAELSCKYEEALNVIREQTQVVENLENKVQEQKTKYETDVQELNGSELTQTQKALIEERDKLASELKRMKERPSLVITDPEQLSFVHAENDSLEIVTHEENQKLIAQLYQSVDEYRSKCNDYTVTITDLRQELNTLKERNAVVLQQSEENVRNSEREIATLHKDLTDALSQITEMVSKTEVTAQDVESNNAKLAHMLHEHGITVDRSEDPIASNTILVEQTKGLLETLKRKFAEEQSNSVSLNNELLESRRELAEKNEKLEKLETASQQAAAKIDSLEAQLTQVHQTIDTSINSLAEELRTTSAKAESKTNSLLTELSKEKNIRTDLNIELESTRKELELQRQNVLKLQNSLATGQEQWAASMKEKDISLKRIEDQLADAKNERDFKVGTLTQELDATKKDYLAKLELHRSGLLSNSQQIEYIFENFAKELLEKVSKMSSVLQHATEVCCKSQKTPLMRRRNSQDVHSQTEQVEDINSITTEIDELQSRVAEMKSQLGTAQRERHIFHEAYKIVSRDLASLRLRWRRFQSDI